MSVTPSGSGSFRFFMQTAHAMSASPWSILLLIPTIIITLSGCTPGPSDTCFIHNGGHTYKVSLLYTSNQPLLTCQDSTHLSAPAISEWRFTYPVYKVTCADVNADGIEDILVGVIKRTRYDSIIRRRLFIFKVIDGYIRPLWLGSRVAHPLYDFRTVIVNKQTLIQTIEQEANGNYLIAEYQWKGFGLNFIRYIRRDCSLYDTRTIFSEHTPHL